MRRTRMSASTHGLRGKIFGLMRNWLGRPAGSGSALTTAHPAIPSKASGGSVARSVEPAKRAPENVSSDYALALPLQTILSQFPPELHQRLVAGAADVSVAVPLQTILPQLAHGSIKISFGELRSLAPGIFTSGSDRDHTLVQLPLAEILTRINPSLLRRRAAQKRTEVPAEIVGPFGDRGQGLFFLVGPSQPEASVPAAPARPAPPAQAPSGPPARGSSIARVKPMAPPNLPQRPTIPQPAARTPGPPVQPAASPVPPAVPSRPATPAPRAAAPVPPGVGATKPPARSAPAASPAAAPLEGSARSNGGVLLVPLPDLGESWPDVIKQEIASTNLSKAIVALPMDFVEAGLKQGRVSCSWKQLRSWFKPAQTPETVSAHDGAIVEMPLKVLAPLFLSQHQTAKAHKRVPAVTEIPDLFFGAASAEPADVSAKVPLAPVGAPAPAAPPTPAKPQPKAPETNYYVWRDDADAPVEPELVFKKGPSSPGTEFLRRYATPNEIVSRTAALDGVAGALISLPDGLLVASRIPPELNADTLAAFLPQIFGRVIQCTKELRMGELNNLNFTVGNVPWKIFKVGAIFFAAFGRAGESLPTAQLVGLAAELDRKPRQ